MSKIKIISTLINLKENEKAEFEGLGIKRDNQICYKENNVQVTLILNDIIYLKRKTSDYEIVMEFSSDMSKGSYNIFEFNSIIDLDIKNTKININSSKIIIDYDLFIDNELMGNYKYQLDYEVI